jgi:hypothetical protein
MKRRKFVLGLGATTTGGSALLGTGAFTSVNAERDIAVDVADDSDAFLRLGQCAGGSNGAYVTEDGGLFGIDLSGDNGNNPPAGEGVNTRARSTFDNVFEICNQGTQEVCVDLAVDVPVIPNGADVPDRYDFEDGDLAVVFYRSGDPSDPVDVDDLNSDRTGAFPLGVGECQCFGIEVRAFGFGSGDDLFDGAQLEIVADAEADCSNDPPANPPDEPGGGDLVETYADSVVKSSQGDTFGGGSVGSGRSDADNAVGPPDDDFFSLGFDGSLVVSFDTGDELVKRSYASDVLDIETTNNPDNYPEERALVEVAGPGTNGQYVEVGVATNKASGGENNFELPAEPITKVRLTDQTDESLNWSSSADGFDVKAVGGYTRT